jgi:hypothetical protein
MPKIPWKWDGHAYHGPNGRYIGPRDMLRLRDQFTDAVRDEARRLTAELPNGQEALGPWMLKMRDLVKQVYTDQYALARGGRKNMDQSDWGRLGQMIRAQYGYLQNFAEDMATGKLTAGQMEARAALFANSGTQAYEEGKAANYGLDLPAQPCDGSTQCVSNCKCSWSIEELDDRWEATWELGEADHCQDCLERANTWNPLVIPK